MDNKFKNNEIDNLTKKILDSKTPLQKKDSFDYAKTSKVTTDNTKVYSSEVNKKNAKKKKNLIILLILLLIFLTITVILLLYFYVFNKNQQNGPSQAVFDIEVHTDIDEESGGGMFAFNCMPGDVFNSPLTITNKTQDAQGNVLVRFKLYVVDSTGKVYKNCIDSILVQPTSWVLDDETGYFYYGNILSQNQTITVYDKFEINTATNNELNGVRAQLILVVDVVESNMGAVYTYWQEAPVEWQLDVKDLLS